MATTSHALPASGPRHVRQLLLSLLLGAAGGAFSSWYIYDTLAAWPLPFMIAVFALGWRFHLWRSQREGFT